MMRRKRFSHQPQYYLWIAPRRIDDGGLDQLRKWRHAPRTSRNRKMRRWEAFVLPGLHEKWKAEGEERAGRE